MHRLHGKLTYSNVVSTLCLVLLLRGAVTPAKLSAASRQTLVGPKGETGATGPQGPRGERGEKGDPGEPGRAATELWAVVSATPEVIRARNAVSVEGAGSGSVQVTFDQDVRECDYQVTLANPAGGEPPLGYIGASSRTGVPDAVFVQTWNAKQDKAPESFHLAVYC